MNVRRPKPSGTALGLVVAAMIACAGGFVVGNVLLGHARPARAGCETLEWWPLSSPTVTLIEGAGDPGREAAWWPEKAWLAGPRNLTTNEAMDLSLERVQ
jgi:hypothetical protein